MATFTFEEFKQEVIGNIMDYLTPEYQSYVMHYHTIQKAGVEYDALIIRQEGVTAATPALNISAAYQLYLEGAPFEEIIRTLAETRMTAGLPASFNKEDLLDFSKIKDRLLPRLINAEDNIEYLADKPYKRVEDLAMIFSVILTDDERGQSSTVVSYALASAWGVSDEDIFEAATANAKRIEPYFNTLEGVLTGGRAINIEDLDIGSVTHKFFVLSTKTKARGSYLAVTPAVMDRIYYKLGRLFVIPSSVDEVIIVPQTEVQSLGDLDKLAAGIREINRSSVAPEDRLSDHIYEYDFDTKTLVIAG